MTAVNPYIGKTYGETISAIVNKYRDNVALTFEGRDYTFGEAKHHIDDASARLAQLGIRPGDNIAIWMPNRPEYVWLWLGAAQMGAVPVLINTRLRKLEFEYQINQSKSVAIFVPGPGGYRDFLGELGESSSAVRDGTLPDTVFPKLTKVVSVDPLGAEWSNVIDWTQLDDKTETPPYATDPDAPSLIIYSSGTTSLPKGVMLSHCICRKSYDISTYHDLTSTDSIYLAVPLFGVFGCLNGVLVYWMQGARVVLAERFEPGAFIDAIRDEGCKFAQMLPTMVDQVVAHPSYSKEALKTLRGGTLVSNRPEDLAHAIEALDAPGYSTAYGMTETTGPVARYGWDDPLEEKLTRQGKPLPGCHIRIVDVETGVDVPIGEKGEILLGGYAIMPGYFDKPQETSDTILPSGWLRSGDLGCLNPDGSLTFFSRIKDGYKHKGFNVSTPEVEESIRKITGIRDVAVVGVPDPDHGECGVAFIIAEDDHSVSTETVLAYLVENVSSFKVPEAVIIIDELPRTAGTGKVQSGELKKIAIEYLQTHRKQSPPQKEVKRVLSD